MALRWLLRRAIAIGRRRETLRDTTLAQYRADHDPSIDRAHLFVFVTDLALRPSVIFRKVTNGFRSEWGAQTYAAFRSVVRTAKANRRSILDRLRNALGAPPANQAVALPG